MKHIHKIDPSDYWIEYFPAWPDRWILTDIMPLKQIPQRKNFESIIDEYCLQKDSERLVRITNLYYERYRDARMQSQGYDKTEYSDFLNEMKAMRRFLADYGDNNSINIVLRAKTDRKNIVAVDIKSDRAVKIIRNHLCNIISRWDPDDMETEISKENDKRPTKRQSYLKQWADELIHFYRFPEKRNRPEATVRSKNTAILNRHIRGSG